MRGRIAFVLLGLSASAARADHHDMSVPPVEDGEPFTAGIRLVAASFATTDYVGNYQGVIPAFAWTATDWIALGATLPLYRLEENGLDRYGPGDAVANATSTLWHADELRGGAALALSVPTGDAMGGLGMGHPMVMPAAWAAWAHHRLAFTASAGYGRALALDMTSHHDHGPWPLVEPMNMSELQWSAAFDVALGDGVAGSVRANGAIPILEPGHDRVVGALRVAWGTRRVETAAEVQAGFVGDPFNVRGLLETALHF